MTDIEHPDTFHGLPVLTLPLPGEDGSEPVPLPEAGSVAWRLEFWFGASWYGGDATVEGMRPVLSGGAFPRLRHPGLRNSEFRDEIATAVASAPVVAQLESLSMETLSDTGALAPLGGQPLTPLTSLDLHHRSPTDPVMARVREMCVREGVHVDLDEADHCDPEDDEPRYVVVGE